MKKTIVVYKSKYGSTEKYATWIAEAVDADLYKMDEIKISTLKSYETIIYCGGLYAGGLLGFSTIKKNYTQLSDSKLIVVAVGATLKKSEAIEEVRNQNLTDEMKENVEFFLLRGGLNYKRMNVIDRFLMAMMLRTIKKMQATELDDDSKGFIATYGKVVDFTNKDAILPVVMAVNNTLWRETGESNEAIDL